MIDLLLDSEESPSTCLLQKRCQKMMLWQLTDYI